MILYDSLTCSAEWLKADKILLKTVRGFVYGDEMETLFNAGYEKIGNINRLFGNRELKPYYRKEDIDWINNDWLPGMLRAGWKYWAVIEPEHTPGKLSMRNFLDYYQEQGIELRIFNNPDDAIAWLKGVDYEVGECF